MFRMSLGMKFVQGCWEGRLSWAGEGGRTSAPTSAIGIYPAFRSGNPVSRRWAEPVLQESGGISRSGKFIKEREEQRRYCDFF